MAQCLICNPPLSYKGGKEVYLYNEGVVNKELCGTLSVTSGVTLEPTYIKGRPSTYAIVSTSKKLNFSNWDKVGIEFTVQGQFADGLIPFAYFRDATGICNNQEDEIGFRKVAYLDLPDFSRNQGSDNTLLMFNNKFSQYDVHKIWLVKGKIQNVPNINLNQPALIDSYFYESRNTNIPLKKVINRALDKGKYTIEANSILYSFTNYDEFLISCKLNGTEILKQSKSDPIDSKYGTTTRHKVCAFTANEGDILTAEISGKGDTNFYAVYNILIFKTDNKPKPQRIDLIKDGVINTTVLGDMEFRYAGGSGSYTKESGRLNMYISANSAAGSLISKNDITPYLKDYPILVFESSITSGAATQQLGTCGTKEYWPAMKDAATTPSKRTFRYMYCDNDNAPKYLAIRTSNYQTPANNTYVYNVWLESRQ